MQDHCCSSCKAGLRLQAAATQAGSCGCLVVGLALPVLRQTSELVAAIVALQSQLLLSRSHTLYCVQAVMSAAASRPLFCVPLPPSLRSSAEDVHGPHIWGSAEMYISCLSVGSALYHRGPSTSSALSFREGGKGARRDAHLEFALSERG